MRPVLQACGSYILILVTISVVLTRRLRRAEATLARRNDTDKDSASDRESSDSGSESSDGGAGARHTTMPADGNIRLGRGQKRCRGCDGDNRGPTASDGGSATATDWYTLCLP